MRALRSIRALFSLWRVHWVWVQISRYRPFKACELSVGDQTILNLHFAPHTRNVWSELPPTYNTLTRGVSSVSILHAASVIHFAGDVKPWLHSAKAQRSAGATIWLQSACGALAHHAAPEPRHQQTSQEPKTGIQ